MPAPEAVPECAGPRQLALDFLAKARRDECATTKPFAASAADSAFSDQAEEPPLFNAAKIMFIRMLHHECVEGHWRRRNRFQCSSCRPSQQR